MSHSRAGMHGGRVVVSQIGDVKQEIVFSGDPVNVAARIQALCRPLGVDFLASEEVLRGVELHAAVTTDSLGSHTLRGRSAAVNLISLVGPDSDPGPTAVGAAGPSHTPPA